MVIGRYDRRHNVDMLNTEVPFLQYILSPDSQHEQVNSLVIPLSTVFRNEAEEGNLVIDMELYRKRLVRAKRDLAWKRLIICLKELQGSYEDMELESPRPTAARANANESRRMTRSLSRANDKETAGPAPSSQLKRSIQKRRRKESLETSSPEPHQSTKRQR